MINRQYIHSLLVQYKFFAKGFFSKKSEFRLFLERFVGTDEEHKWDGYKKIYAALDQKEEGELNYALLKYIGSQQVHDLKLPDNQLIHDFLSKLLIFFELDAVTFPSQFRNTVDRYFLKLNQELHLIPETKPQDQLLKPLDIWLQHVIDYPELYISHIFSGGDGNFYNLPELDLSECGCVDVSHDRRLSDIRLHVEKMVLDECKKFQTSHPKEPLPILSFGPGKGLQDFIIILKLLNLGIKNIKLTFIESTYNDFFSPPTEERVQCFEAEWKQHSKLPYNYLKYIQTPVYTIIRALSLLSRHFPDSQLTIFQYDSVKNFSDDQRHDHLIHIIYGIDLEEYDEKSSATRSEFHALAPYLAEDGIAILSHHYCIEQFKSEKSTTSLKQVEIIEYKPTVSDERGAYLNRNPMKCFFKI